MKLDNQIVDLKIKFKSLNDQLLNSESLENKEITIYGNGSQTRSFCYVDDTVEGLIRLMNQEETIGPINIGNPYEMTIKELAEKCLIMIETQSTMVYKELPSDDPMKRQPDISKAKKYLDWSPIVDLEDGLKKTIDYFRN